MQDDIRRKTKASGKTIGSIFDQKPLYIEEGTYKIYPALDDTKLVDMSLTANADGTHNVKLYRDTNALESRWYIAQSSIHSSYVISNKKNESLKLAKARSDDDYNAVADPAPDYERDWWDFADAGSGRFYIYNQQYHSVLELIDGNTADNANIGLRPFTGETEQKFRLVEL